MLHPRTFRGGIHPPDQKHYTRFLPITELPVPDRLIFPVSQHIGAPAEPVVQVGERVSMGQLIARPVSSVSAGIHASVSGTVCSIEPWLTIGGVKVQSILIENDHLDTIHNEIHPNQPLDALSPEEIVSIVQSAGITGMGGASFPTHVKLFPPEENPVDTVIINGAECEPYLTCDHRVMLERPVEVLDGCLAAMKAVGAKRGMIAVENNKPDAIEVLASANEYPEIQIIPLQTKYPQGSEKQVIQAATGRMVPGGGLPFHVGVVVLNIATSCAISRAIRTGMPLVQRVVTLSGKAIRQKGNYQVRLGTPVSYLIEQTGGFSKDPERVIAGGPLMGQALASLEASIVKGTSAVLALTDDELGHFYGPELCFRCAKCVEQCPVNLQPLYLDLFSRKENLEKLEQLNIMDCIECGCCSYVCPGNMQIVQNIRVAKQKILQKKAAHETVFAVRE